MIKQKDKREILVYTNLLMRKGYQLFLRYDVDGDLIILTIDLSNGGENINHFDSVKELEDWIFKPELSNI